MTRENIASWFTCSDTPADRVKAFVLKETKANNLLCYTIEEITNLVGVGISTVKRVMKDLEKGDLIKYVSHGKWFVNPDKLYSGKASKREELQKQYYSIPNRSRKGD